MGYIGNPLDPWGAADPGTAYGGAFEAMAASGAYDVLVLVHDFPYRSLASEVATANEVTGALLAATAGRARHPAGLRVADLRRAAARDQGAPRRGRPRGTAPARRRPGLPGDRRGRPLGATPRASPGRRAMAARLAGAGGEPDLVRGRPAPDAAARPADRWRCPSARASALVSAAGIPVTEVTVVTDAPDRGRRGAPDRATGRAQARRRRAGPQERGRRAGARAAGRRRGLRRRR